MRVAISGVPDGAALVSMRDIAHLNRLKNVKGLQQKCDYLIFLDVGHEDRIVAIELKTTLDHNEGKNQLYRSCPIVQYLVAAATQHGRATRPVVIRNVIIAEGVSERLDKQRTRHEPDKPMDVWSYRDMEGVSFVASEVALDALAKEWG